MIRELFKRWSNLATTECTRRETSVFDSDVYTVNGTTFFVGDINIICFMPGEAEMWLEWAVQQAIVARGWRFGIQHYSDDFQVWVAAPNRRYCWSNADNSATALLSAYVRALSETVDVNKIKEKKRNETNSETH